MISLTAIDEHTLRIRQWTARCIEDGGVLRLTAGLCVKYSIEVSIAAMIGIPSAFIFSIGAPIEPVRSVVGASTNAGLYLGFTVLLVKVYTYCTVTKPIETSQQLTEDPGQPAGES